jgi:hypothetical protein
MNGKARETESLFFFTLQPDRQKASWLAGKEEMAWIFMAKSSSLRKSQIQVSGRTDKKKVQEREQLIAGSSMKFRHALGPDIKRIHTMSCLAVDGSFLLLLLFLRELPYVNGAQMAAAPTPHERRKLQRKIAAAKAD